MTLRLFVVHEDAGFAADEEGNQLGGESSYLRLYLYLKFVTRRKLAQVVVVVVVVV